MFNEYNLFSTFHSPFHKDNTPDRVNKKYIQEGVSLGFLYVCITCGMLAVARAITLEIRATFEPNITQKIKVIPIKIRTKVSIFPHSTLPLNTKEKATSKAPTIYPSGNQKLPS